MEAMKEQKTTAEIAKQNGVHPSQVQKWKTQLRARLPELFADGKSRIDNNQEELIGSLYQQIGKLQVELDWLKKNSEYLY